MGLLYVWAQMLVIFFYLFFFYANDSPLMSLWGEKVILWIVLTVPVETKELEQAQTKLWSMKKKQKQDVEANKMKSGPCVKFGNIKLVLESQSPDARLKKDTSCLLSQTLNPHCLQNDSGQALNTMCEGILL